MQNLTGTRQKVLGDSSFRKPTARGVGIHTKVFLWFLLNVIVVLNNVVNHHEELRAGYGHLR